MEVVEIRVILVAATRVPPDQFMTSTALGRSLSLLRTQLPEMRIFGSNTAGLSTVYNHALRTAESDPTFFVFIHDDVAIIDYFWLYHLYEGLQHFDLIGLAGNTHRVPHQSGWAFVDQFARDIPYLSGTIGHEDEQGRYPNVFGPTCQEVKLLDGVMLACHSDTLLKNNIRFDEQFDFHFYDLDLCRQFERAGLRMGTWGISMVHSSKGRYGSLEWCANRDRYFAKWGS